MSVEFGRGTSPFTARVRGRRGSIVTVYAVAAFGAREQVADRFECEIDDVEILDASEVARVNTAKGADK